MDGEKISNSCGQFSTTITSKDTCDSPCSKENYAIALSPTERIINYIESYITENIENNVKNKIKPEKNQLLNKKVPKLSISNFYKRIIKYTSMEDNTLILSFIYLKSLVEKNKIVVVTYNIYRIILGLCVIALKFLEDVISQNSYLCKIGGLTLQDFNTIEVILAEKLDFSFGAKNEEIQEIKRYIFGEDDF